MNIFLTGINGFVGKHLLEHLLLKTGYKIIGYSRNSCNTHDNEKLQIIHGNLSETIDLDVKIDVIIHAAAQSPEKNVSFSDYYNNNIVATQNVVDFAKRKKVKKIIYLSTVSAYGRVENILTENTPRNNLDDYGLTKYVSEKIILESGIPSVILVLPGIVGKGCKDIWLVRIAEKLLNDETITYNNSNKLFNNAVWIDDLCKFIEKIVMTSSLSSKRYILGMTEYFTIKEVIYFLKEKLDSDSEIKCLEDNINSFYIDVENAKKAGYMSISIKELLCNVCEIVGKGKF